MIALGFRYVEVLRGVYHLLSAPVEERPVRLTLEARIGLQRLLFGGGDAGGRASLKGDIEAAGLATRQPVVGTLGLRVFEERRVRYDLAFEGDDGAQYRLGGQKNLTPVALADSFTLLPASLYDGQGLEVGRATLRFDPRGELRALLKSLRLDWGSAAGP